MNYDVIIIGAGAAGLLCAIEAGKRERSVFVVEHNAKIGEKIRISGGGRCNFTNINTSAENFISQNPHFCKSALSRYTSLDFIKLVKKHGIRFHEKKLGQLFCDGNSNQIIKMLMDECRKVNIKIETGIDTLKVEKSDKFSIFTRNGQFAAHSLAIATGGLSIPRLGATNFGHRIASQFGLNMIIPRPGLVPLVCSGKEKSFCNKLSGVSIDAEVRFGKQKFQENILFTHSGLSGPAILQISSYWKQGEELSVSFRPDVDWLAVFRSQHSDKKLLSTVMEQFLPGRFVRLWLEKSGEPKPMNQYSIQELERLASDLSDWKITPTGTENFGKAEVTVGGVDTNELSSRTMETNKIPGLYFVGEVVDVTGWLGGYNFQWAWSSGWVAGQFV